MITTDAHVHINEQQMENNKTLMFTRIVVKGFNVLLKDTPMIPMFTNLKDDLE